MKKPEPNPIDKTTQELCALLTQCKNVIPEELQRFCRESIWDCLLHNTPENQEAIKGVIKRVRKLVNIGQPWKN